MVEAIACKGFFEPVVFTYKVKTYDYKAIDAFVDKLYANDYECCHVWEGILGSGDWICVAPDGEHCYVIRERFVTSWSSTHTVEKFSKIPKKIQKELDDYYAQEELCYG